MPGLIEYVPEDDTPSSATGAAAAGIIT
jgi:hypothetical protein